MHNSSTDIIKIRRNLTKVPPHKLKEVNDFIEFILFKHQPQKENIVKFEGIWKGLGFEKVTDLESDIRQLRKESTETLLNRVEKWNI